MRYTLPIAAAIVLGAASACAPLRSHQGYIVDSDLVNAIRPGVDNRESVVATLGQPSFRGQFNSGDFFYIARESRNFAFNSPRVQSQVTLQISFDPAGNVAAIRRSDEKQVAAIDPSNKKTATLGRERSFFEDLFGNIGAVGTAGGPGAGAGGGSRDTP